MSSSFNLNFYQGDELKLLSDEELALVSQFDLKEFPNPWTNSKWEQVKSGEMGPSLLVLAYKELSLLGFALFGIGDPDTAHLYKILVSKDYRGSGLGKELICCSESYLKKNKVSSVFLEVEQSNLRALAFYQKHGYQVLVEKKGFYGPGRNAFALEHILS